ncbi:MAG: DUF177 domain-containing protein [Acidimicrobiales bacterium]|nr:DUF177 domain-containing protein [Acidimicrobiales bacterium]
MTGGAEGHPPRELVSVTEIRRHLGSRLAVTPSIEVVGMGLSDVRVPDGSEIVLTGEVESISEGVVLTGTVAVPWTGACRRCLNDVTGVAEVEVREIYETDPVEGETWPLEQDHIDVGPLLHDTALLALPLAPLCSDDCAGPAPGLYPTTVVSDDADLGEGDDAEPPRDPRWAALDGLDLDEG